MSLVRIGTRFGGSSSYRAYNGLKRNERPESDHGGLVKGRRFRGGPSQSAVAVQRGFGMARDTSSTAPPACMGIFRTQLPAARHFASSFFFNRQMSERSFSGRKQKEWLTEGNVVIMPANVPHQDIWDKPGAFTLLILDPLRVTQVVQDTVDAARLEIVPRFAMREGLIQQIAIALEVELTSGGSGINLYPDTLAAALSAHLLRNHSSLVRLREAASYARGCMRRAVDFVSDNFHQNLKLAGIAAVAHLSKYHFARTFKQVMGVAPHQFLIERRIEHAQALLRTTALSVEEIARRAGFSNQSHFTAHFKKVVGATPRVYRSGF